MELDRLASILESVRLAPLRNTDLLVFRTGGSAVLTLEQKSELHQVLEELTGHQRIVILDGGSELAILRTEPEVVEAPAEPERKKVGSAPGAIA